MSQMILINNRVWTIGLFCALSACASPGSKQQTAVTPATATVAACKKTANNIKIQLAPQLLSSIQACEPSLGNGDYLKFARLELRNLTQSATSVYLNPRWYDRNGREQKMRFSHNRIVKLGAGMSSEISINAPTGSAERVTLNICTTANC